MNDVSTLTRVKYFGGEYLLTADFQAEQDYHRFARKSLSAGVLMRGIVSGLTITFDPDVVPPQVVIAPGRALDSEGRLLVLATESNVSLSNAIDGQACYVVMQYQETAAEKRIVEQPAIDVVNRAPLGAEVLLAVVVVEDGKIVGIDHTWGQAGSRRHVGAVLGSIEFPLESASALGSQLLLPPDPTPISIVARKQSEGAPPTLEISAPNIALYGDVSASAGTFQGKFIGDGSGLTHLSVDLPPAPKPSPWQQNGNDIFYTYGNVGIGDSSPSALLRVQGATGQKIGTGLATLGEQTPDGTAFTLNGYQTSFEDELHVGDVLSFGSVQGQEVEVVSIERDQLTLKERFAFSVGWCDLQFRRGSSDVQLAPGRFLADGTTVISDGTADFSVLRLGDRLVISAFVSQSNDRWLVVSTQGEVKATIENVSAQGKGDAPPNGSAFAISESRYAVDISGGATIDDLTVTDGLTANALTVGGNAEVDGNLSVTGSTTVTVLTANTITVDTTLGAAQISCGNGFKVANGLLQCIAYDTTTAPIGSGMTGVYWGPLGPYEADAIVSSSLVPYVMNDTFTLPLSGPIGGAFYANVSNGVTGNYVATAVTSFPVGDKGGWVLCPASVTFVLPKGFSANFGLQTNNTPDNLGVAWSVSTFGK